MTTTAEKPGTESVGVEAKAAHPLDQTLARMIKDANRNGDGFALAMDRTLEAGEKRLRFSVERPVPSHDEWEPRCKWRDHTVEDADSLVTFAKRYTTAEKGLIVFNDDSVVLSIDELQERGERELVVLEWAYSDDWDAWTKCIASGRIDHRTLLNHCILQQHTLESAEILDSMRRIKATMSVDVESDIRLEHHSAGVWFKAAAGSELLKFPRAIKVKLPVLDMDAMDETRWMLLHVRVEIYMPMKPGEPVLFQLLAPGMAAVRKARIDAELKRVREGLDGWTIVRGEHKQRARTFSFADAELRSRQQR